MAKDVLNPFLYARLQRVFGKVKITNQGEKMVARTYVDVITDKLKMDWEQKGEYYRANCFACSDTKFRFYVSYMFGKRDDEGRRMTFLAHCFNEQCMHDRENQMRFADLLQASDDELEGAIVKPGKFVPEDQRVYTMPGLCERLDKLPAGHDARSYVASRQFDPDRLARVWGVSYCSDSIYYLARRRLVVPIWYGGKLRGWQCRYVGELDWKGTDRQTPKYFTAPGMARHSILCNLDMAKRYKTGVLVEGWFDVFGFGPMAVCSLGDSTTSQQLRAFVSAFRKKSAVLLYDPEALAKPSVIRLVRKLRTAMPHNFVAVKLPAGTDPGSLGRSILREIVEEQAEAAKVKVDWRKE